ncbi:hypothetical protein CR513_02069, partial [Mucuna pruriens]
MEMSNLIAKLKSLKLELASWNGQQYFITLIDNYSRYSYLYLIHEKSQSLDVFKSFKTEVELQLVKKIKAIKFDRGAKARPYRPHERKLDSRTIGCYFVGYVERSRGYKFYDPTSRSFFETGNVRILEEVEFEKEENIRNAVFEEEFVNDIGQVLLPITVQEITPVIGDNVQIIVPDIVPKQDYDEHPKTVRPKTTTVDFP